MHPCGLAGSPGPKDLRQTRVYRKYAIPSALGSIGRGTKSRHCHNSSAAPSGGEVLQAQAEPQQGQSEGADGRAEPIE